VPKLCSNCGAGAQYSVVAIVSSVGVSPRIQQSSPAVLFCDDCLRELSELVCSDDLRNAVNSAYTQLKQRSSERFNASETTSRLTT
jgi:hypothetical protein